MKYYKGASMGKYLFFIITATLCWSNEQIFVACEGNFNLENGSLYIFTCKHFKKIKNRLGGKIGYVIFPEDYSIQLDSKLDIDILEKTLKNLTS